MKFKSIMAALAICLAAISCNKNETPAPICADGTYAGSMSLSVQGSPMEPVSIDIQIKNHTGNELTIVAPSFTINAMGMQMAMPEMSIEKISAVETEGLITLKGAPFKLNVEMMGSPMIFENKKGLTGTLEEGKLKIAFDITPGAMPMSIDCAFEGKLK